MHEFSPSRRAVLRAGGALGAAAVAGCLGDGGPGGGSAAIDTVPAGVSVVVHADVAALLDDDVLRDRMNELLNTAAQGAGLPFENIESALDAMESSSGLDPREVSRVTLFSGYESGSPGGLRMETDWSESATRDALAAGSSPTGETYNDRTVYRLGGSTVLGVLGEGTYVLGTAAGVEGSIDVAAGDAAPVGGRVREAYEAAPAGAIRLGFESPPDLGEGEPGAGPIDPTAFGSITHGSGGYVIDGGERSASITLQADSAGGAESVATELRSARDFARGQLEEGPSGPGLAEELDAVLASLEISADGTAVRITAGEGEVLPVALVAILASFVLGLGGQQGPVAPTVDFGFEFDPTAGELTILHRGGDVVPTAQLFVRGRNLGSTGNWAELGGDASGDVDGQPGVVAGDRLTLPADADYVARVVWQSPDGTTSAELAVGRGPDA